MTLDWMSVYVVGRRSDRSSGCRYTRLLAAIPLNRAALPNSNPIFGTDTLCYILSLLQVLEMGIPLAVENFTKSS
jgi:hypothetical protein